MQFDLDLKAARVFWRSELPLQINNKSKLQIERHFIQARPASFSSCRVTKNSNQSANLHFHSLADLVEFPARRRERKKLELFISMFALSFKFNLIERREKKGAEKSLKRCRVSNANHSFFFPPQLSEEINKFAD